VCKDGTFLGFILYTPVDTSICPTFKVALRDYTGPTVKVNSLRRYWNQDSEHYHGRAIDLELSPELVTYLTSEDGQRWLDTHRLTFYIEGKPGSQRVKSYQREETAQYVFFNSKATGDHIHIQSI
jgi:hypothetical protein